jgi:4a-hydroxytetrahydrobiopterin dehydratase
MLSQKEINEKLNEIPGWEFSNNSIGREFQLKDFKSALEFLNKIGNEAENMDHHPDIFLHSWNKVKITISTHSAGGVTQNDFNLAKRIENIS